MLLLLIVLVLCSLIGWGSWVGYQKYALWRDTWRKQVEYWKDLTGQWERYAKSNLAVKEQERQAESARRQQAEYAATVAQQAEAQSRQLAHTAQAEAERARAHVQLMQKNRAEIDEFLRQGEALFRRQSRLFEVTVLAVPETGRVGVQWRIKCDMPTPPRVRIMLDDVSDTEDSFEGTWIKTLLRGRTYSLVITAEERGRQIDDLAISLQVPTLRRWQQTLAGSDARTWQLTEQRKQLEAFISTAVDRGQAIKEAQDRIAKSGLDPEQQEQLLAQIQAWIAERGLGGTA